MTASDSSAEHLALSAQAGGVFPSTPIPRELRSKPGAIATALRDAVERIAARNTVVVVDGEGDQFRAHLVFAAQFATVKNLAFMVRHTSGFIRVAMSPTRCAQLALPQMVDDNENPRQPAYTVTVDAAVGGTTGISASDRARTMRLLADPHTRPSDLTRPGHILPLRGVPRGLLRRRGFTEAALELVRLADLEPAAAVCELVSVQGPTYMPSADETTAFVHEHRLGTIPISVLVSSAKTSFGARPY